MDLIRRYPTATPMMLSGLASSTDVDIEHVAFAPFAFDPLPQTCLLHYDHILIRLPALSRRSPTTSAAELMIRPIVDHPEARRCNACGDVLDYSLHDTDRPSFFARVEKVRLREISLVPAPVDRSARVLRRELPSPMSAFGAAIQQANHR